MSIKNLRVGLQLSRFWKMNWHKIKNFKITIVRIELIKKLSLTFEQISLKLFA